MCVRVCACVRVCNFAINAVKSLCCIYLTFEYGQTNVITRTHHVGGPDEIRRNACNAEHVVKRGPAMCYGVTPTRTACGCDVLVGHGAAFSCVAVSCVRSGSYFPPPVESSHTDVDCQMS